MSKLGDMAKLAGEAKKIQKEQNKVQIEQIDLLRRISRQLEEVITLLKAK
ncbi:MAG: hypothetical protein PHP69_00540 [Candidatus Omnitrophica bacterium]|nr:hypothetical protein [Candidatus Omnitrophota bacterium]MDD5441366.1 hypothetical protein [Candidatus Omnitrophota bacterium]